MSQFKLSKIQITFNDLEARKAKLADLKKQRHDELLLDSADYERLTKKLDEAREARKKIELDFDQKNPDLMDRIDTLSDEVADLSDKLSFETINAYIKGEKVELIKVKNQKKIKLTPSFRVAFKQQKLFDA